MKLSVLLLLAIVTGCAAHKAVKTAHLAIPARCITAVRPTEKTRCDQIDASSASCSAVVVNYSCLKVAH